MTTPYFYIIKHKITGKKYAGSRWAKNCNPNELLKENGYLTSSPRIHKIINEEGIEAFSIETILQLEDPYSYETIFLKENACAESDIWFNTHNNENRPVPYGSKDFQELMMSKYGVTHNTMIPEIKNKMIESAKLTYKNNPEMIKSRALKIANNKKINGTTGKGLPKTHTNNGLTGKWKRNKEWCNAVADRQKIDSLFVKNNPMNNEEKRKLVSLSKIGRKRYYNEDRSQFKYCIPGQQPDGWILA